MTARPETSRERRKRHFQRSLFDGIAARYQDARPDYPPEILEFVAVTAALRPGAAVLEIGCGTGQLTAALAGAGFRVTANDIGASMIACARLRPGCISVRFEIGAFEDLTADEAAFDLVISSAAFHWIDPEVAFAKSARLLRAGGWLALLGTADRYDEPVGRALDQLWIMHGDSGGAWQRRQSDSDAMAGTGLFGRPECVTDTRRAVLSAAEVTGLESTRATFLGWPHGTQRRFMADLERLLERSPAVGVIRQTSVTMAPVLRDPGPSSPLVTSA